MGEDVKTNVVKRTATKVLNTPFKVGEEERDFLVEEMIQEVELANKYEAQIEPLKEKLKEHIKGADRCRDNLVQGKTETIEVEETLDFEEGVIAVVRKDNGKHIETRKMTPEDYQLQTTDEPVEKEPEEEAEEAKSETTVSPEETEDQEG